MEQITVEDIKREYGNQVRGNVVKANRIEVLEAENAKLSRQVSDFRRERLDEYKEDNAGTMWQCGFSWGLVVGAVFATVIFTLAVYVAPLL